MSKNYQERKQTAEEKIHELYNYFMETDKGDDGEYNFDRHCEVLDKLWNLAKNYGFTRELKENGII